MNRVTLIGRLTKDVDLQTTASGMSRALVTVAIDRHDQEANTDFPQVTVFGKTAENLARYCGKGSLIGIEGRIQTGSYEKEGRKIFTTSIIADRVEFLGKRPEESPADTFAAIDEQMPF